MPVTSRPFGTLPDGRPVPLFTLEDGPLRASVCPYGARLVSASLAPAHVPLVLGFGDVLPYATGRGSLGVVLGRVANRISGGGFPLDGRRVPLETDADGLVLHGGASNFGTKLWEAEPDGDTLVLRHDSPEGEGGFPGRVHAEARWRLYDGALELALSATTTAPTPVALAVHPYFNLGGPDRPTVLDHELRVDADAFLPTDARQLPTGERRPVPGTPFDFRDPHSLRAAMAGDDEQLRIGAGLDHCLVLRPAPAVRPVAWLRDPPSGRTLVVETDQPALQLYAAGKLDLPTPGHGGARYARHAGLAIEPQNLPDAVNHPDFPSPILRPGQTYRWLARFRFGEG